MSCTGYTINCNSQNQENVLDSSIYYLTIYLVHIIFGGGRSLVIQYEGSFSQPKVGVIVFI